MHQEILDYIKQAKSYGLSETEIKQNLLDAGWEAAVVEENLVHAKANEQRPLSHLAENPPFQTTVKTLVTEEKISFPPKQQNLSQKSYNPNEYEKEINSAQISQKSAQPEMVTPNLSDSHFQDKSFNNARLLKIILIAVLVLIVLGAGGYLFYVYAYNNPTKIWSKFINQTQSLIYKSNSRLSYADTGEFSQGGMSLKDIKFNVTGNYFSDGSDAKNPLSSADIQYTFGSGNTNFSTGLQTELINKILYLKVGDNPFLNQIFQSLAPSQKIDWLKLDLNALENQIDGAFKTQGQNGFFDGTVSLQMKKIWQKSNFIKVDKYIGKENINGVATFHYQNTLDKQAVKTALGASIDLLAKTVNDQAKTDSDKIPDSYLQTAKSVAGALIDKLIVQDLETWIGAKDFMLYKIKFASNAPSVIQLVQNGTKLSQSNADDAKRLADVRQMASALEIFYNNNNGYPDALNGVPQGLTPTYFATIPTAPPADGNCTDYYNTYWYRPLGNKKVVNGKTLFDSYEFTFCLGTAVGGYEAGIGRLSPGGVQGNIACPKASDHPELCSKESTGQTTQNQTTEQKIQDFVSKMNYSAQITFESTYSDYGKKQVLQPPASSTDLLNLINNQPKPMPLQLDQSTQMK